MASASNATAIAFMVAAGESFNVMSAMNSSPWTAESFGGDDRKAKSCMEYVMWTAVVNFGIGLGGSLLSNPVSWWPLIGTTVVTIFAYWLYERAIKRAQAAGSTGWADRDFSEPLVNY